MAAALGRVAVARLVGSSVVRAVGRTAVFPSMQRSFASVPHMSDKLVHVTFSNNAGDGITWLAALPERLRRGKGQEGKVALVRQLLPTRLLCLVVAIPLVC